MCIRLKTREHIKKHYELARGLAEGNQARSVSSAVQTWETLRLSGQGSTEPLSPAQAARHSRVEVVRNRRVSTAAECFKGPQSNGLGPEGRPGRCGLKRTRLFGPKRKGLGGLMLGGPACQVSRVPRTAQYQADVVAFLSCY